MAKKNILILGAGFGGLKVFSDLLRSSKKHDDIRITVIDKENFFLFSPLLHEVAVGVLLPENIIAPIRKLYRSKVHQFVQAHIKEINLADRKVTTSAGIFSYDYIVLALGGVTDMSEIANIRDTHHVFLLKAVQDAAAIKNHIMEMFEKASTETDPVKIQQLLTFVISGGGYTGVELAASLSDVIHKCMTAIYQHIDPENIKIIVLESEDRIMHDLPLKYSLYIMRYLQSNRVEVMLDSKVTRVGDNCIEINGTDIVSSQTLLYVPGIVANPVISAITAEKDALGRAVVNDNMELKGFYGAYAVGDCAHFQDPVSGQVARPRAHNAVRQARVVADNLMADVRGTERKKYYYSDSAEIISLGRSNAVLRVNKFWFRGMLAVLIWVISYSLLAIGRKNRAEIAIDWILSRIFGPDTTIVTPKNGTTCDGR